MGRCGESSSCKAVRYTPILNYNHWLWGYGAVEIKARLWGSAAAAAARLILTLLQEVSWDHPYLPKESYFTCQFFSARKVR